MIQTTAELSEILRQTELKDSQIASLPIPESTQIAFAIEVPKSSMLDCWRLLRSLMDKTHRYPVLTSCGHVETGNWQEDTLKENYFYRPKSFFYDESGRALAINTSPQFIIDTAKSLDGQALIKSMMEEDDLDDSEYWWDHELYLLDLKHTQKNYGISPELEQVKSVLNSEKIVTEIDFERWLLNWELDNVLPELLLAPRDLPSQDWYRGGSGNSSTLLLLPTSSGWETLAYIGFYDTLSAHDVSFLKHWHDQYGAELVAHYGTMLQFYVRQKPKTLMEAFELASEHYLFASDTLILPGVSIREHAIALLNLDRWFLRRQP